MTTRTAVRPLAVLGNPNSLGSYAAGQEQAPNALRAAGVFAALRTVRDVTDIGDLPVRPWRPDPAHRLAQNWPAVLENLQALHGRLAAALRAGHDVLVIGGNCLGALAAVAALRDVTGEDPGLLYVDRHFDANTPTSVTDGALDWMGIAHALALPDTVDELRDAFGPRPLLRPDQLVFLGVDDERATAWELDQRARLKLRTHSSEAVAQDPIGAAVRALADLPDAPTVVNVDVDVLDFTDAPLAEDTAGRNTGPSLAALGQALVTVFADARPRVLCISELNPTRTTDDDTLRRFIETLTAVFSRPSSR